MARLKASKVVAALPATLEPNTKYYVRVGVGFDEYLTDSTGSVAHPLNAQVAMLPMFRSGRLYCEPDNRWIAVHDDNYGASIHQWNESAATGADPLVEWEHLGEPLRAGHYIKDLDLLGQSTATEVTDLEIAVRLVKPNNPSAWLTGIDSDNEINSTEIYRGLFLNPVGGPAASGNSNDKHRRIIPLNHNVAEDSEFRIYMKPVGNITARRYFRLSYALNFSLTTLS